MSSRRLIAALLGVLLLLGSPTPLLAGVVSDRQADASDASIEGSNGMNYARAVMDHSDLSLDCGNAQPTNCHLASSHCSSTPVYGVMAGSLAPAGHKTPPASTPTLVLVYQSPIAEVLTPPPDYLS